MLEAARRDWYGHGPASSFFASGTILLLKSWKGAAESDRTSAASAMLLLPVHAHRDPVSVCLCACILLAVGSTQERPKKAILEYVISTGS